MCMLRACMHGWPNKWCEILLQSVNLFQAFCAVQVAPRICLRSISIPSALDFFVHDIGQPLNGKAAGKKLLERQLDTKLTV